MPRLATVYLIIGCNTWAHRHTVLQGLITETPLLHQLHLWLQERIMTQPFGAGKEYFKYSLFLVLCNRMLTVTLALGLLLARLVLLVSAAI